MCNNQFGRNCNCGCSDSCKDRGRDKDNCKKDCSRFKDESRNGCQEIEFDFQVAECGIKDVKGGINQIERGCLCDGIQCVKRGICNLEKAIKNLSSRFDNGCIEVGCKTERLVDEAICSLEKSIEVLCKGLEAIEEGCIREGIKLLERGISIALEGLNDLAKVIKDIC